MSACRESCMGGPESQIVGRMKEENGGNED